MNKINQDRDSMQWQCKKIHGVVKIILLIIKMNISTNKRLVNIFSNTAKLKYVYLHINHSRIIGYIEYLLDKKTYIVKLN